MQYKSTYSQAHRNSLSARFGSARGGDRVCLERLDAIDGDGGFFFHHGRQ